MALLLLCLIVLHVGIHLAYGSGLCRHLQVAHMPQCALWVLACAASIVHLQPVKATMAFVGLLYMSGVHLLV